MEDLRYGIDNARAEADAWGTPLLFGEFGIGPTQPNADAWMAWEQELHDEALASNAFWRSSTVVPLRPAAALRSPSTSAVTGSSQERVMPSLSVMTESRTPRRAL